MLIAAKGHRWREGPLAKINTSKELEAWLRKQPREVSVAFAARAALRVLPIVQTEISAVFSLMPGAVLLPVFRATATSWAVAKYPAHEIESGVVFAAHPAAASSAAAFHAANATVAARTDVAAAYHAARATVAAASDSDAIWSAVSIDATRVEEGAAASVIAGSPLWPQGQPDQLQSWWREMKAALLAEKQDWQVWTIWYDDRLEGRVRDEKRELTYVRIEEALWKQGPAIVNAEIRMLAEEHEPPPRVVEVSASGMAGGSGRASLSVAEPATSAVPVDNPPIAGAAAQHYSEVLAGWQSADAALQPPQPRRQYVPDVFFNPVALADTPPAPIEAIPEQEPLATIFCVNSEGLIDVVPDPPAPGTAADS